MITEKDLKKGGKFRVISKSIGSPFRVLAVSEIDAKEIRWKKDYELVINGFLYLPKDVEKVCVSINKDKSALVLDFFAFFR